jgi:hypothetical protein
MPSTATIASYASTTTGWSEFTPTSGTIKSAQVMANFGIFRGHFIPMDPTVTAATDGQYDLGSADHRWRNIYGKRKLSIVSTTGSMSLTSSNDVVFMDATAATISANLPDATGLETGTSLIIKNIGTGSKGVMLTPFTAQKFENTTTAYEIVDAESKTIVANGASGWYGI